MLEYFGEIYYLFIDMAPYLLLGLLFAGILKLFFSKETISKQIGGNNSLAAIKASLFGVPLPLCSCGVIPTSVYLSKNGASDRATVSFLISTPQTGFDSILATYGMMGWIFAIFRPIAAFFMGVFGGIAVGVFGRDKAENSEKSQSGDACDDNCNDEPKPRTFVEKIKETARYSFVEFLDDISIQFIIGLIIAGAIAMLIPDTFFEDSPVTSGVMGMGLMILVGAPMYICATASIPIAVTLLSKGFSAGAAFVFLAVGPATNAASLSILLKTLGKRTTYIYIASIIVGAVVSGLALDFIFYKTNIDSASMIARGEGSSAMAPNEIKLFFAALFFILSAASVYRKIYKKFFNNKEIAAVKIKVEGMTCNHCKDNVEKAVAGVEGVKSAVVDLEKKTVGVEGDFNLADAEKAIEKNGYKVVK